MNLVAKCPVLEIRHKNAVLHILTQSMKLEFNVIFLFLGLWLTLIFPYRLEILIDEEGRELTDSYITPSTHNYFIHLGDGRRDN